MEDVPEPLKEDEALARAAQTALDRAEAGDGTVSWSDVHDVIPAEQWGRLLESDLLIATEAGFVIDDPPALRSGLESIAVDPDVTAGDDGWSLPDKLAGVGALGLMASYQVPFLKDTIGSTAHLILGPVEATLPFGVTVALLAVVTTLVSTALRKRLVDGEQRERLSDRLQQVEDRLDAARERGDDDAVDRLQSRQRELMVEQLSVLKQLLRPMVYTMLVTIPVFLWLSWLTMNPMALSPAVQLVPFMGRIVWTARVFGPMQVWMVWYFACNVLASVLGKRVVRRTRPIVGKYRSVV